MSATLDGKTPIEGHGKLIVPDPFVAALDVKLDALDLRSCSPTWAASTAMTIRRGQVRATGKLGLTPPEARRPD